MVIQSLCMFVWLLPMIAGPFVVVADCFSIDYDGFAEFNFNPASCIR